MDDSIREEHLKGDIFGPVWMGYVCSCSIRGVVWA
jgi:hypothetical protein